MNNLFAPIYEGFYPWDIFRIDGFSDDMYDSGTYAVIGWFLILSSAFSVLLFYYFLSNYGSWYKRIYWFSWILIICVVNFIAAYYISVGEMDEFYSKSENGSPWGFSEHFSFSMVNVLWAALLGFVLSILLKKWSIKASRTPF